MVEYYSDKVEVIGSNPIVSTMGMKHKWTCISFASKFGSLHNFSYIAYMKITKNCNNCGKDFQADSREVNRGNAKFCSRTCANNSKKGIKVQRKSNCTCAQCKVEFYRRPSKSSSKSGLYFCSRACKDKAQRIGGIKEIQPFHYSNSLKEYRLLVEREVGITHCNRCGYKEFPQILQVHHKDRDRKNNDISNLEVLCPNCHSLEHIRGIGIDG